MVAAQSALDILVRMPNWLGDCVMAMPALARLRQAFPGADLYLAGRKGFNALFSAQEGVAGFIEAPASGFGKLLRGISDTRRILRSAGVPADPDLGLLFTNSLSTAAWMWRSGAKSRIGYDLDCRRFFLTHPVPCGGLELSWHFIQYYLWLAAFAETVLAADGAGSEGATAAVPELVPPRLRVGDPARAAAAATLRQAGIDGQYAVLAPASAYGPVKDWPPHHYRRLIDTLRRDYALPVVITGGGGQTGVCRAIAGDQPGVVDLSGKTDLDVFAALVAGASLFVGGDSGGAHVAAAMGIPTVVIFGITNPTRTCPTGERVRTVGAGSAHDVRLATPAAREAARQALEGIAPERVAGAVEGML
ncbi:MAG: glycosyltransferase family 9 protein [Planctomycetes bacterium]|nr:glycosyltransferase family 9 protein [Planctomycetota bacterium]